MTVRSMAMIRRGFRSFAKRSGRASVMPPSMKCRPFHARGSNTPGSAQELLLPDDDDSDGGGAGDEEDDFVLV